MHKILSYFCHIFLRPIVRFLFIKEVRGLENIPRPPFILASNHQSHLDQIFTAYVAVPQRFHMIGQVDRYNEKFLTKILRDFLYFIGETIPVDRRDPRSREKALREAVKVLKRGDVLIIYPEGTRTRKGEGEMGEPKPGVGKIHLLTGAPILPVALKGTFEILPPGKVFPKIKKIIKINVGKPIFFKKEIEIAKNLSCQDEEFQKMASEISIKVMEEIKNLYNQI